MYIHNQPTCNVIQTCWAMNTEWVQMRVLQARVVASYFQHWSNVIGTKHMVVKVRAPGLGHQIEAWVKQSKKKNWTIFASNLVKQNLKRQWTLWFPMGILMSPSVWGWAPVALVISPLVSLMHDQAWNLWIWALVDCHGMPLLLYGRQNCAFPYLWAEVSTTIPLKVWRFPFRMRFKIVLMICYLLILY